MGTLGRAIFTAGKWISGTGHAMDRLGSTVQGGLRVEEQLSRHRTIMNIFEKEPRIHRDVIVAPSAAVIGDVEIGHGYSILRGYTSKPVRGRRPSRSDMATLAACRRLLPRWVTGGRCRLLSTAAEASPGGEEGRGGGGETIYVKKPAAAAAVSTRDETSVAMPVSFMTGSVVGKRFYRDATVRPADDGNGWTVMLDYRTLKSPAKRPLKLASRALAMAIAAEWEYQESDGIRPFTMPLMKLACTASERVPVTRKKIIDNLMKKFHQDLVFCRSPADSELTMGVHQKQKEKIDPVLDWVKTEFGFRPAVYTTFFGGKQEEGLTKAVQGVLTQTTDFELASIDAMASAAHSLVIPLAIFRGRLGIEEAIELIRLEEDHQVDKWGLVEGGHDVDVADLKVQMSSAVVFLGLSRGM